MRLNRWAAPLAVVVVVAALVAGAVWLATGSATGRDGTGGRPAVLHLSSAGQASTMAAAGVARAGSASSDSAAVGGYVLDGELPSAAPADQPVYRLPSVTSSDAGDVADALGLTGSVRRVDGGFVVGGNGHQLVVR